jgi:hypothetical protein
MPSPAPLRRPWRHHCDRRRVRQVVTLPPIRGVSAAGAADSAS